MSMSLSYSTVWSQLASPYLTYGAIPFVSGDGGTIRTDVSNFRYIDATAPVRTGSDLVGQLKVRNGLQLGFVSTIGLPAQEEYTINAISGIFYLKAGETEVRVNSDKCFLYSIVLIQRVSLDATALEYRVGVTDGHFTLGCLVAATADVQFRFIIFNTLPSGE